MLSKVLKKLSLAPNPGGGPPAGRPGGGAPYGPDFKPGGYIRGKPGGPCGNMFCCGVPGVPGVPGAL